MKREYKIAHFHRENERAIFRKYEDMVQWLSSQMVRTAKKQRAMRFLHEQDCVSALSVIKMSKWELKTEEEYIEEKIGETKEKKSWSDF